jgi:hypothetical protein
MKTILLATCVTVFLAGCASTANYVHSTPSTLFVDSQLALPASETLKDKIQLQCMRYQDHNNLPDAPRNLRECLYVTTDASKLLASASKDIAERDEVISYLTAISDFNCSNFMMRAFALRTGMDASKSFLSDLATGASAGTAFSTPALSAGLSLSNLVVGKGVDAITGAYYFGETFSAMESLISAERMRIKRYIRSRQATVDNKFPAYDLRAALSDIRDYDDACSIKFGLGKLKQNADKVKTDESAKKIDSELDPSKAATFK